MENDLLGIGRMAALSGLPVSALRFYDQAGVLLPSIVDPSSGYRYYRDDQVARARIVAHLRRVGLPLDDIKTVVDDPARANPILASHLDRLEAGLADARREISIVHHLLETESTMHRCTLSAHDLISALKEVRYAVCTDPNEPRLNGVYLDSEADRLRLVATDRYRLALSSIPTDVDVDLHLLLPTDAVDELLAGTMTGSLDVVLADGDLTISGDGGTIRAAVPDVDFPAYQSLISQGRREVTVDAAALREALAEGATHTLTREQDGVEYDVSQLSISESGVQVGPSDDPEALVVSVNREFLLQALETGGQLTLDLDEPITPLAIRNPDRDGVLSILMPVRLPQSV